MSMKRYRDRCLIIWKNYLLYSFKSLLKCEEVIKVKNWSSSLTRNYIYSNIPAICRVYKSRIPLSFNPLHLHAISQDDLIPLELKYQSQKRMTNARKPWRIRSRAHIQTNLIELRCNRSLQTPAPLGNTSLKRDLRDLLYYGIPSSLREHFEGYVPPWTSTVRLNHEMNLNWDRVLWICFGCCDC